MRGVLVACALSVSGCSAEVRGFDAARARGHIETLAGTIGSRPHGSPESALARDYIARQLRSLGFDVRFQDADAVDPAVGLTARVRNVIARRDGELDEGIGLVSHYDSRPEAAGALDDALGVAVSLEAARLLIDGPALRHTLYVLVTDAEEVGLMGARAMVTDPEITSRLRAFLNLDGTGAAGRAVLFETTGGTALDAWARGAAAPDGSSIGSEIYRRLPNDTDFTLFRRLGATGLNFAAIEDSYGYHTDRDVPSRVRTETLRHATVNAASIVRTLDAMPLTSSDTTPTYFDLLHSRGVVYGPAVAMTAAVVASVLAAVAWVLVAAEGRRQRRLVGLLLTVVTGGVVMAASAGGAAGAVWIVGAIRSEQVPWYAAPAPYVAFFVMTALFCAWLAARLMTGLPARFRPWQAPGAIWFLTLPVWMAATIGLQVVAPAASYLVALPLLVTAIGLLVSWRSAAWIRLVSFVSLVLAAVLCVPNTVRLIGFMAPLFGWMPVAAPAWLLPALAGTAGVMLVPGAVAMLAGRRAKAVRVSRMLMVLGIPVVACGGLTLMTPAYTEHRPQRRSVVYLQDQASDRAAWQVSGREPVTDLAGPLPDAVWGPVGSVVVDRSNVAGRAGPFRAEAASPLLVDAADLPAVVRAEVQERPDGGRDMLITIVPRELTAAAIALPPGVEPLESSLPGREHDGRWTASHAAIPSAGLSVRIGFGALEPDRLRATTVTLVTARLPGPRGAWPAWLPSRATTWSARSVFVIPAWP